MTSLYVNDYNAPRAGHLPPRGLPAGRRRSPPCCSEPPGPHWRRRHGAIRPCTRAAGKFGGDSPGETLSQCGATPRKRIDKRGPTTLHTVPAHPARRPGRRRGRQPQAAGARRLHPPCRPRHLHLAAAGPARAGEGRGDRPRGNERHRRPGGALPGAAAARALRGDRPLDRVRRGPVPAQGPQGRRLPAGPHPRGDVHPPGQGPLHLLQGPAGHPLPDPDQVPRRGPSARRPAARPRVRHEGLLLLRRRRRRPGGVLPGAPRART